MLINDQNENIHIHTKIIFEKYSLIFRYFSKSTRDNANQNPAARSTYSTWNRVFNSGTRIWRTTRGIDDRERDISNTMSHKNSKAYLVSDLPKDTVIPIDSAHEKDTPKGGAAIKTDKGNHLEFRRGHTMDDIVSSSKKEASI